MSTSSPNYFLPHYLKACEKAGMLDVSAAAEYLKKSLRVRAGEKTLPQIAHLIIALNCIIAALGIQAQVAQEIEKIITKIEAGAK